jgi:hypothetical protein
MDTDAHGSEKEDLAEWKRMHGNVARRTGSVTSEMAA